MPSEPEPTITIGIVPQERWQQALELTLSRRPTAERLRLIWAFCQGDAQQRLVGLLEARHNDHLLGATLAMLLPGRSALIYQPRLVAEAPPAVASLLWTAQDAFLKRNAVRIAQEMLPCDAHDDAAAARAAGFEIEVELLYYSCAAANFPPAAPMGALTAMSCPASERPRLERLIERTYVDTLDCPELNGVRSSADVIDGYLENGPWLPDRWLLLQVGGVDVGCLLTTRHSAASCELVYLGLVPEIRGRGLGKLAIQHALWLARQLGCDEMTVAFDVRNTPARRIYEQAGFREYERRRVLLRVI
ncbi:MAG TPA: GNAT family N-acetyltransferase [Pirellulaceae bacterium]|nr:GNAT family N-acetyltransferase [Pirellulaceae bacterium]